MLDGEKESACGGPRKRATANHFRVPERAWLPALLAVGGLIADVITPRGVADGFFYTVAILACLWLPSARAAWVTAAFLTPLFALGHFLSPLSGTPDWIAVVNRLLSLLVMWISAALVAWRVRTDQVLEQATLDLQIQDRRKDEFLATLAHELRNPLAPIRNAVAVLKRLDAPADARLMVTDVLDRQVQTMARLLDDLLDVSRVTRGKLPLHKERVGLRGVIEDAVEVARPAIDVRGHRLSVEPSVIPDSVLDADPLRLIQAIANLLTNAAKYTPAGGLIQLSVDSQLQTVSISVKDCGVGLDSRSLTRIFDIFYQVRSSHSEGGLGIGLALVKAVIDLHGGSVEARSNGLGLGSEFIIRLPRAGTNETRPADVAVDTPTSPSPLKVLVVDDNADAAATLAMLLRLEHHEVHVAHDGREGLEAALRLRPDVAIVDIGMPHLDGYDVAREIRRSLGATTIQLIALTGWGQEEDRRRAREAGFDAHLTKPVDPQRLRELLG